VRRTRTFPPDRQSVPAARRFANETLVDSPPDLLEAIELMVSELATNCVRHVRTRFELMILRTREEIRIEVTDHGGGVPRMRSPGPDDPTGRGLRIVDMLSEQWGVLNQSLSGKTVWFSVPAAVAATELSDDQEVEAHSVFVWPSAPQWTANA
jgi:hypothetical protein